MASIWHDMFNAEEGERKKEKKDRKIYLLLWQVNKMIELRF